MSWLTRLFKPKPKWLDKGVHAWCYNQWGRSEVWGNVISENGNRLVVKTSTGYIASVWAHDTRLPEHALPPGQPMEGT